MKPLNPPYTRPSQIAVGLVAFNNHLLTAKAVNSIPRLECGKIYVVDNASTDNTHNWLQAKGQRDEDLHWWSLFNRKSLALCWNVIMNQAIADDRHYVLMINNDIQIKRDYIKLLHYAAELHHCGFISGISQISESEFRRRTYKYEDIKHARNHPDFSCFLISTELYKRVGQFDESFFPAYCEDNDYHVRMHRAGYKALCVDLPFYHTPSQGTAGANAIKSASADEREQIRIGADKNRQRFKDKYGCLPTDPEYATLFE